MQVPQCIKWFYLATVLILLNNFRYSHIYNYDFLLVQLFTSKVYHVYSVIINAVSESKGHTHIELHKLWY